MLLLFYFHLSNHTSMYCLSRHSFINRNLSIPFAYLCAVDKLLGFFTNMISTVLGAITARGKSWEDEDGAITRRLLRMWCSLLRYVHARIDSFLFVEWQIEYFLHQFAL